MVTSMAVYVLAGHLVGGICQRGRIWLVGRLYTLTRWDHNYGGCRENKSL